eukprot:gnl/TRDRNA2_/TRDRNA2_164584_c0_seq1.p1 gnl/TRDRNA2_/TRDRNA2_164584_c0~~gnl/TRDRNA2_/TRDRNA2_164584_c0_seq1.p1  ORF type:complete len:468 (-),score=59.41 gnl/TRDRNA2_/TRDRNA2_164584_c0_seq1:97-1383(-)
MVAVPTRSSGPSLGVLHVEDAEPALEADGRTDAEAAFALQMAELQRASPRTIGRPVHAGSESVMATQATGDAELALRLQLAEARTAAAFPAQAQQAPWVVRMIAPGGMLPPRERYLTDPVWGDLRFEAEEVPRPYQAMSFACCPCVMIGCGFGPPHCCRKHVIAVPAKDVRRAWLRFGLSFAVVLTVVQVCVLAYCLSINDELPQDSTGPMVGLHPHMLDALGAKNAARILYFDEWWRLLTPMALHGGLLHLALNALFQLRTGVMLEVIWGHGSWLFIYITSGAYASLASCILLPGSLSVGSSGSLFGLVGAWVVFIVLTWNQTLPGDVGDRNTQLSALLMAIVITSLFNFVPLVDFASHLGGFVAGALLATIVFAGRLQDRRYRLTARITGLVAFCVLVVASLMCFTLRTQPPRSLLDLCHSGSTGC